LYCVRASDLAMKRALRRVHRYDHALIEGVDILVLDLGPHTAIVDGDALSYAIASASIVAKVTRDRLMSKLASRYPGYGWEHNVGYATRHHLIGLRQQGLTPFHRTGYAPVRMFMLQPTSFDDLITRLDEAEALAEQALESVPVLA
jgi:ribonuclease HII